MAAPDNEVVDTDHGLKTIQQRLLDADGMEVKVGWLTGKARYSKKRGGTAVAGVAGIHMARFLGAAWDRVESKIDARLAQAAADATAGRPSRDALIEAAQILQDEFRKLVKRRRLFKEGHLHDNIRFRVTERLGGKGRPRIIAGDL